MTKPHLRHGYRHHPLYATWCNIKARCDNKNHPSYENYGGRGIFYDPRWSIFPNFLTDVGDKPFPESSLDRINNDGPYTKENCRWASRVVQRRNSRQTVRVTIDEETKLLTDWCRVYNISIGAVHRRLRKGDDLITAITKPKAKRFIVGNSVS